MLGWRGFGRRGSWNRSTGDEAWFGGGRRRWGGERGISSLCLRNPNSNSSLEVSGGDRSWGSQSAARGGSRIPAVGGEVGSRIELFLIGGACSAGSNSIDLLLSLLLAHGRSVSGSGGIVRYRLLVLLELVLRFF